MQGLDVLGRLLAAGMVKCDGREIPARAFSFQFGRNGWELGPIPSRHHARQRRIGRTLPKPMDPEVSACCFFDPSASSRTRVISTYCQPFFSVLALPILNIGICRAAKRLQIRAG